MKRNRFKYENDSSENDSSENDSSESSSEDNLSDSSEDNFSDSSEDNDINYINQFEKEEDEEENEFKLPTEIIKHHESGYKYIIDNEHPEHNKLELDDYSSLYKDGKFYETEPLHTVISLNDNSGLCKQCNNYGILNDEGICNDYCKGELYNNIPRLRSFGRKYKRRFSSKKF